jgi:hypothetical protein
VKQSSVSVLHDEQRHEVFGAGQGEGAQHPGDLGPQPAAGDETVDVHLEIERVLQLDQLDQIGIVDRYRRNPHANQDSRTVDQHRAGIQNARADAVIAVLNGHIVDRDVQT